MSWRYPWSAVGPRHEKFDQEVSPWSRLPAAVWVCNRYKRADHDTRRNAANSMSGKRGVWVRRLFVMFHLLKIQWSPEAVRCTCRSLSLSAETLFRSFGTHFQTNGTTWLLDCMLNLLLGNPEHRCTSAQPLTSSSVLKPASWDYSALRWTKCLCFATVRKLQQDKSWSRVSSATDDGPSRRLVKREPSQSHSLFWENAIKCKIDTENAAPIRQPARKTLPSENESQRLIQEMMSRNIIEPAHGPWLSPVVLAKKRMDPPDFVWISAKYTRWHRKMHSHYQE